MATNIDTSRLAGWFKDRFGEDGSMLPEAEDYSVLAQKIAFDDSLRLGEKVTEPVRAGHSTGYTFAGGSTSGTMFALNAANSPQTVEASYTSQEFVLRERTSWKAMGAAQTTAQAFGNHYDDTVADMRRSSELVREACLLYGGSTWGKIESQTGSSTSRAWVLEKASTAPGLWYRMHGALFDVYDSYGGSKANTNADIVIASVEDDPATDQIVLNVTGNATDLSAIDTDITNGDAFLIPKGASDNMMTGIDGIVGATSYAGISTATYPQWGSSSLNAQAAGATFSKLMQGLKRNTLRSGGGPRSCLVSIATMVDIADNITALQRGDKGGGKFTLGTDEVVYEAPGMQLEFLMHRLCKEGESFIVDFGCMSRIGWTDITFDPMGNGNFFNPVDGFAGTEFIAYWDQGLRCKKPNSITKITNIVNTI